MKPPFGKRHVQCHRSSHTDSAVEYREGQNERRIPTETTSPCITQVKVQRRTRTTARRPFETQLKEGRYTVRPSLFQRVRRSLCVSAEPDFFPLYSRSRLFEMSSVPMEDYVDPQEHAGPSMKTDRVLCWKLPQSSCTVPWTSSTEQQRTVLSSFEGSAGSSPAVATAV